MLYDLVQRRGPKSVLAVGLGRSYGDSGLNSDGCLLDMRRLNRIISFDRERGVLIAEAGLSLDHLLQVTVPAGWFVQTTPGTRFVTLGGAIANDVHGKNHHRAGTFGRSVRRLGLLRSDGSEHVLDRTDNGALFRATIGGLGLTGIITWVELDLARIPSSFLDVERRPFGNLDEFFSIVAGSDAFEHTVAWIDCAGSGSTLGRGIFQRANWSEQAEYEAHGARQKVSVPVDLPGAMLNKYSVRAFNALYYRLQKMAPANSRVHYAPLFYPLDSVGQWNRLYGRRGFFQYQCVLPPETAHDATAELLTRISHSGGGSFLAVLKTFGDLPSAGMLSFPREGTTLALDFPNKGEVTLRALAYLDQIVLAAGGRLYPAKDGRMPGEMFRAGYPELTDFSKHVDHAFSSDFWRRISN